MVISVREFFSRGGLFEILALFFFFRQKAMKEDLAELLEQFFLGIRDIRKETDPFALKMP